MTGLEKWVAVAFSDVHTIGVSPVFAFEGSMTEEQAKAWCQGVVVVLSALGYHGISTAALPPGHAARSAPLPALPPFVRAELQAMCLLPAEV